MRRRTVLTGLSGLAVGAAGGYHAESALEGAQGHLASAPLIGTTTFSRSASDLQIAASAFDEPGWEAVTDESATDTIDDAEAVNESTTKDGTAGTSTAAFYNHLDETYVLVNLVRFEAIDDAKATYGEIRESAGEQYSIQETDVGDNSLGFVTEAAVNIAREANVLSFVGRDPEGQPELAAAESVAQLVHGTW